jgi:hypothetical protein
MGHAPENTDGGTIVSINTVQGEIRRQFVVFFGLIAIKD